MFVFGGAKQTGALFCGCSAGTYYLDADGDGRGDAANAICGPASSYVTQANDCSDSSSGSWSPPGEVRDLRFTDATTFAWTAPLDAGGTGPLEYDVLRSTYTTAPPYAWSCPAWNVAGLSASDAELPPANRAFYYLVRATNACPGGLGPLGSFTDGRPIVAKTCP